MKQQRQLALRRKRGFRFVHQIDPLPVGMAHEVKKAFSVGNLMIVRQKTVVVVFLHDRCCNVEETLRPEEIPCQWSDDPPRQTNGFCQTGQIVVRAEVVILCSAFRIEAVRNSNGFQQRGLSGTVFAHKECHVFPKLQIIEILQGRNMPQIRILFHFIPVNRQSPDKQIIFHQQTPVRPNARFRERLPSILRRMRFGFSILFTPEQITPQS